MGVVSPHTLTGMCLWIHLKHPGFFLWQRCDLNCDSGRSFLSVFQTPPALCATLCWLCTIKMQWCDKHHCKWSIHAQLADAALKVLISQSILICTGNHNDSIVLVHCNEELEEQAVNDYTSDRGAIQTCVSSHTVEVTTVLSGFLYFHLSIQYAEPWFQLENTDYNTIGESKLCWKN